MISDAHKLALQEIVAQASQTCGDTPPRVLLAGGSERMKQYTLEVLTNELKLKLLRVDLDALVGKYIGETEKNLDQIFESVRGTGTVIFFDEADALFGKRSEVRDSHDRFANLETSYLLQKLEGYDGIAILATSDRKNIDEVFLRHFRFVLDFC